MIEIERKFLTPWTPKAIRDALRQDGFVVEFQNIEQIYFSTSKKWGTRIRKISKGSRVRHVLTMKSKMASKKFSAIEIETPISEAQYTVIEKAENARPLRKRRWIARNPEQPHVEWFIDHIEELDLVLIEAEVEHEETVLKNYPFLGEEVTGRKRYSNARMFKRINASSR